VGSDDRAREHLRAHPLWRLREDPRAPPPNSPPSHRRDAAAGLWGSPWPPPECAPTRALRVRAGPVRGGPGVPRVGAAGSGPGRRGKLKTWKPRTYLKTA
jgi:hypothetical protein